MIIGFIGAGKMARALAAGLVRGAVVSQTDIRCTSRRPESSRPFLDLLPGAGWSSDNAETVRQSDLIILAIKPQVFPDVVPALHEASAGKLVLSIASALTIEKIGGWLHPTARIVRAMPNTPMQVGAGASVYAGGANVTDADFALIDRVLSSSGKAWRVDENQIDAITALSGSGPAYVFHFIEALIRGAVPLGIPAELAQALAIQTVLGSAQLAANSPLAPMELAAQVKSPRGTTLAACAVFEENDALNRLVARALEAAKKRAEALARGET